jgi:hypothetical protein
MGLETYSSKKLQVMVYCGWKEGRKERKREEGGRLVKKGREGNGKVARREETNIGPELGRPKRKADREEQIVQVQVTNGLTGNTKGRRKGRAGGEEQAVQVVERTDGKIRNKRK